jgi:hypothetical protein
LKDTSLNTELQRFVRDGDLRDLVPGGRAASSPSAAGFDCVDISDSDSIDDWQDVGLEGNDFFGLTVSQTRIQGHNPPLTTLS